MPIYRESDSTGLRDVDKLIVMEYFRNGFIKSKAWATYHPRTTKRNSIESAAQRFFSRERVQEFLKSITRQALSKSEITPEKIVEEYGKIGFSVISDKITIDQKKAALDKLAEIYKMIGKDTGVVPLPGTGTTFIQFQLPDNGFGPKSKDS